MKISKTPLKKQDPKAVSAAKEVNHREQANIYIKSAIDELGKVARDDVLAKEAIANLAVVLLDLK